MIVSFNVRGKVIGKPRPRFTTSGGFVRAYTPKPAKEYEKRIRDMYLQSGAGPMEGPVQVLIDVYRALPKSRPKRLESEQDISKPDIDNVAKIVLDALNGAAWKDDSQVVSLIVEKHPRSRVKEEILRVAVMNGGID